MNQPSSHHGKQPMATHVKRSLATAARALGTREIGRASCRERVV